MAESDGYRAKESKNKRIHDLKSYVAYESEQLIKEWRADQIVASTLEARLSWDDDVFTCRRGNPKCCRCAAVLMLLG